MLVVAAVPHPAVALNKFKKPFEDRYVRPSPDDAFKALAKKTNCIVCHVKGEKKDVYNSYGKLLDELIPGRAKQRIDDATAAGRKEEEEQLVVKELEAALNKVEGMKVDPKDAASPTYGELLKSGRLPTTEAPE